MKSFLVLHTTTLQCTTILVFSTAGQDCCATSGATAAVGGGLLFGSTVHDELIQYFSTINFISSYNKHS
jgi:hypothetical protein